MLRVLWICFSWGYVPKGNKFEGFTKITLWYEERFRGLWVGHHLMNGECSHCLISRTKHFQYSTDSSVVIAAWSAIRMVLGGYLPTHFLFTRSLHKMKRLEKISINEFPRRKGYKTVRTASFERDKDFFFSFGKVTLRIPNHRRDTSISLGRFQL